jgi:integrase
MSGNDSSTHAYILSEVKRLMAVIKLGEDDWRHTMRAAFMVALFTGLRLEEIKGLRWEDYDKKGQLLHVRRSVVNHQIVEDTKTKASAAPVPVVKNGGARTGSSSETKFRRRVHLPQDLGRGSNYIRAHRAQRSASGVPSGWYQVPRLSCTTSRSQYRNEGRGHRLHAPRRHHAAQAEERHGHALWPCLGEADACGTGEDRSGVFEGQVNHAAFFVICTFVRRR